jgi:hypothetical protein
MTPTLAPTSTPTDTPTPQPDGATCTDDAQCVSMNCVDQVCCDTPCDGQGEQCFADGVCRNIAAPAPALGPGGLAAALLAMLLTGAAAFRRRRRAS